MTSPLKGWKAGFSTERSSFKGSAKASNRLPSMSSVRSLKSIDNCLLLTLRDRWRHHLTYSTWKGISLKSPTSWSNKSTCQSVTAALTRVGTTMKFNKPCMMMALCRPALIKSWRNSKYLNLSSQIWCSRFSSWTTQNSTQTHFSMIWMASNSKWSWLKALGTYSRK